MHVPQRWFNAYPWEPIEEYNPPEWRWYFQAFREGALQVHLPGNYDSRATVMNEWLNKTDTEPEKYHVPLNQTT
jgi:hypothetical protein